MERQISQGLKIFFLIHAIIAGLFGVGLWMVPGRVLIQLGWIPTMVEFWVLETVVETPGTLLVDPFITRVLGAALLALAYTSLRGWRASQWCEVSLVVQFEVVFCTLGFLGMIVSLILVRDTMPGFEQMGGMPIIGWVIMILLAGFSAVWIWFLQNHTKTRDNKPIS